MINVLQKSRDSLIAGVLRATARRRFISTRIARLVKSRSWLSRTLMIIVSALVLVFAIHGVSAQSPQETTQKSEAPQTGPQITPPDVSAWLDGFLPYALQANDIAGAVVAVVKDGKVVAERGYGYADIAAKKPMDPGRSVVDVGSISKMFTWTAVMQLVEQGKIDLDRDVNDYLDFKIPPAFGKPITMRNLMTHTPGFEERIKQYIYADSPRPLGAYLKSIPSPERIYAPGTVPAYSNYGANLAGYIVERVSGETFPDYIEHHIFKPLGMDHSTFLHTAPEPLRGDVVKNYSLASSGVPVQPETGETQSEPAGDVKTTAGDITHFMLAHLQQGQYSGYQVLKPETERLMQAPAFVPVEGVAGMGLGFFRIDDKGQLLIAHDGDSIGAHASMVLIPAQNMGLFMAVNSDGPGSPIGAADGLRQSLVDKFILQYFPRPDSPEPATVASAKHDSQIVAGEYQMSRRPSCDFMKALYLAARIPVKANDDGTIETPGLLNFGEGRPQTWREVGPFVWKEVDGSGWLHMKVEDGKVKEWLPDELGSSFVMEPVPTLFSAGLNLPLLEISIVVLLIAVVAFPIAAMIRRRYRCKLELAPAAMRARRLAYLAIVVAVVFLLAWAAALGIVGSLSASSLPNFVPSLDKWIRLVQLVGLLCVAGVVVAIWNAWVCWRSRRDWFARISSVVVSLALLDVVWFAFAFSLISLHLNY